MISMTRRQLVAGCLVLSGTSFSAQQVRAQPYPSRPIHLLVGGAAGSVPDTVARLIADRLTAALRQQVVVENRPGAGGNIAMQGLVASEPDGHTIALATMSQAVFNSYLFANLPYDPLRDLAPISPLVTGAFALAAHPTFPANTLTEFIRLAKAEPGKLLLGTTQLGSPPYVTASMLLRAAGIKATLVPFRSGQDGMTAVVRGDTQVFVDAPTIIVPQVRAGTVKVLAVTGREREPELPDVPTVAEAGLSSAQSEAWIGLVASARTSAEIIERLNHEITVVLVRPDVRERLRDLSFTPITSGPEEFRQLIRDEHTRWGGIIREAGLRLE